MNNNQIIETAQKYRLELGDELHDSLMGSIYSNAQSIAEACVEIPKGKTRRDKDLMIDKIVTSRVWGFPIMLILLAFVFWLTVVGSNVPSQLLASFFIDTIHPLLKSFSASIGLPWWLDGVLIDGGYLALAWVVSVMLPPMAIFFPLFTLAEDFGYLPRVAFNMDNYFRRAGAHGKQALTMSMGFGCNAAGVVAARIIDSPRERLIAIITNNFSLCNGRWPTQILIASIFLGAAAPAYLAGIFSSLAVVTVALLGIFLSLAVSYGLSKTVLKGEASTFVLELPPYRPPRLLQTLYTSLIDRTLIVLWRAILFAAPAGIVIWLVANVYIGDITLAEWFIDLVNPIGMTLGLNGVILLAFVIAIPANEIVIPTILMLTVLTTGLTGVGDGAGVMFELESFNSTAQLLHAGGWTMLTGINLMLFSLLHNPCSTTIFTIYKETKSLKWTTIATFVPIILGIIVCFSTAQLWNFIK